MHERFTDQRMRLRSKFPNIPGDVLDSIIDDAARTERRHIEQNNESIRELLVDLSEELNLIVESDGIAGYHLNGEILEWGATEFPELHDRINNVLKSFDK